MSVVIGWDIGGAHLKAARVSQGRVEAVVQAATPLWLGLDSLHSAFDALCAQLGRADRHVITMTGELCDAFPSRREGVAGLAADRGQSSRSRGPGSLRRSGRVRRTWRSRLSRRRHRLGELARQRRARRAQASGRVVHRHRLDDNGHHSRRRGPGRRGRLQRRRATRFGRADLYRDDAQLRHVPGFARAVSRRVDSAHERIFRSAAPTFIAFSATCPTARIKWRPPTDARRPSRLRGRVSRE